MNDLGVRLAKMAPESRQYALQSYPTHLAESSQAELLYRVLTNFHFIQAKIFALGPEPLIEDYDLPSVLELSDPHGKPYKLQII